MTIKIILVPTIGTFHVFYKKDGKIYFEFYEYAMFSNELSFLCGATLFG